MEKPRILLINDDGIHAPGLKHLWHALKDFCKIQIAAPAFEQSGVGVGLTFHTPLHIRPVAWEEETPAWQVSGTPADCVRLATRVLMDAPPDLIVSGINRGANFGRNILHSGTVGGIIEGVTRNIPGIAFSCEDFDNPCYEAFESQVYPLVEYLLDHPLENGSFLNVNFPSKYGIHHKGCVLARQGLGYFKEQLSKREHPEGIDSYWMGGSHEEHEENEESDIYLVRQGYISVVPIYVKELTDREAFSQRRALFNEKFQLKT